MAQHYEYPILFVVRHPAAVIASRMKMTDRDWSAEKALERYRADHTICALMDREYGVKIDRRNLPPEIALAYVWCIENALPLRWADRWGYTLCTYENLLGDPRKEWERVGRALNLERLPDTVQLKQPSQQASQDMRDNKFDKSHVGKWRDYLGQGQLEEISAVLESFAIRHYSIDQDMPLDSQ
jgi:hypothetical protein